MNFVGICRIFVHLETEEGTNLVGISWKNELNDRSRSIVTHVLKSP